ncbi:circadian locomoter output cycles protein kaput-like isoform X1 [Musca domestica]|uniref:Circadian locomoter output cycles protein kaput-like isoform X1 n=3 Tax=Musca domestica TaxID=7370 RepID=A0ABM3VF88_MUSDO|nr:circadian locomoter output cycles protein kaput-like isoform X1 [Musca domestica]
MEDDTDDRDDTKRRSRNLSEKKRRDQFNSLVNDLSALISTSNRKMDKSTVLKSTITFLKHHNEATDRSKVFEIQQEWKPSFLSNDEFTQLMLESLDGFIIVFGSSGSIFYTSDSVTAQLGYLPCDLMKMTIFDLSYEMDHEILLNMFLNPKPVIAPMQTDIGARNQITFFLHLKRRGTEDGDRNSFELVKFVGYFRNDAKIDVVDQNTQTSLPRTLQRNATSAMDLDHKLIFVGTGRLQMPQMIREITVTDPTCSEFTSKHSMEWKFLFLDQRAPPIIGYMPFEVLGTSGYDYYHFDDIDDIVSCHEKLMQEGKVKSGYYRFLTKGHQWIWLQTDSYISYNQYTTKPEYVVCTHKVINYIDVLKYGTYDRNKPASSAKPSSSSSSSALAPREMANKNPTNTIDTKLPVTPTDINADTVPTLTASTAAVACTTPNNNMITVSSSNNIYSHPTNLIGDILRNETPPSLDSSTLWTNPPTPTGAGQSCQLQAIKSNSRPASSYGNISSTGVSPNVKRKRYMYNCRGNESDSTSMSAESGTSRQSLMTHMSTGRQRFTSNLGHSNYSGSGHHQQQNLTSTNPHHHSHFSHHQQNHSQQQSSQHAQSLHQQQQMQMNSSPQGQRMFQSIPAIVQGSPIAGTGTCQFSQPTFPIRSPQIVAPPFIESPQYLTAIPVQPVIAPFQVAPVISPLPHHPQHEMIAAPVVMTPSQNQLQEQLQRKHDELQKLILQQQDELRIVSEQLLLARYTLLQPMMPVNYGQTDALTLGNNSRNINFNNNAVQQQFNQYGFAMNSNEMNNQQIMLQHQQNLQQQLQHSQAQRHQCQQQQQQQQQQHQASQQLQANMANTTNAASNTHPPHQPIHSEEPDEMLLNRNVPDLEQFAQEEFDAFLNLSPLQNIGTSEPTLNSISATVQNPNAANPNTPANISSTSNPLNSADSGHIMETTPYKGDSNNAAATTSEDSIFSYIQLAAESSHPMNFNMNISDDITDANVEDNKLMSHSANNERSNINHADHHQLALPNPQPTSQQNTSPLGPQQSQRSTLFAACQSSPRTNDVQLPNTTAHQPTSQIGNNSGINNNPTSNNNDSSALSNTMNRILPFQIASEPLENIFNTTNSSTQQSGGTNP